MTGFQCFETVLVKLTPTEFEWFNGSILIFSHNLVGGMYNLNCLQEQAG